MLSASAVECIHVVHTTSELPDKARSWGRGLTWGVVQILGADYHVGSQGEMDLVTKHS